MSSNLSSLKFVDHTYRDFSRYIEEGGELIKHKKCGNNFPRKVHNMLSDEELNSHVICWMPHGRAFKVLNKKALINEIIPNYFICRKYESFTRQLNGWGFKRLYQSGPDLGCYYHEAFLRGLPDLTTMVRRLPPNLGKSTPFAAGEPNFYRISEQYPVPPPPKDLPAESKKSSHPEEAVASVPMLPHGNSQQSSSLKASKPSVQASNVAPNDSLAIPAVATRNHTYPQYLQPSPAAPFNPNHTAGLPVGANWPMPQYTQGLQYQGSTDHSTYSQGTYPPSYHPAANYQHPSYDYQGQSYHVDHYSRPPPQHQYPPQSMAPPYRYPPPPPQNYSQHPQEQNVPTGEHLPYSTTAHTAAADVELPVPPAPPLESSQEAGKANIPGGQPRNEDNDISIYDPLPWSPGQGKKELL